MPSPNGILFGRSQVVLKAEAVPGTAETLESGAGLVANAEMVLADQALWSWDTPQIDRAAAGLSFDTAGSVGGIQSAKITFRSNLRGRTSAFSSSILPDNNLPLKACGCSVTFSGGAGSEIVTVAAVTGASTFYTAGIYRDGMLFRIAGALGNVRFTFRAGEPVLAEYELTGAYVRPSDVALRTSGISPASPPPPPFRGAVMSILGATGASARISEFTFDLGNTVIIRQDPSAASGVVTALITGRKSVGKVDPEAVLVATKNFWQEMETDTTGSITTGDFPASGTQYDKLNLTIPKAKYTKVDTADSNNLTRFPIDFEAQRQTDAGDDAFSLVFK